MEQSIKKLESKTFSFKIQRLDNDFSQIQENKSHAETDYITLFHRFVSNLQVIWKYGHEVGSLAEQSSLSKLAEFPKVVKRIKEKQKNYSNKAIAEIVFSTSNKDSDSMIEKKLLIYDLEDLTEINKIRNSHDLALNILNESLLQQIVNAWELLLGDILTWSLNQDPSSIPKDHKISYSDILNFSSLDEAKSHIVENEVSDFLRTKSTKEQISLLKKLLNINFQDQYEYFDALIEIILRRHIVVHAGGIASADYCNKVTNFKKKPYPLPKTGEKLPIDTKYIKKAWTVVYSAGVVLIHMAGKRYFYSQDEKEKKTTSDSLLIYASYTSINNEQYEAAKVVLEYANKLTLSNKEQNLIVLVNLAQVHKWQGDSEKCLNLLDREKWNMYSSLFNLCVSSLREDLDCFKKSLVTSYQDGAIGIIEIINWPIFKKVRQNTEFCKIINEVLGKEIKVSNNCDRDALLKLDPNITTASVLESMINELSD